MGKAADVIEGRERWSAECADALAWLRALPNDSVDLLFTSPPYELCRTYGMKDKMVGGQAWVDWMHEMVKAAAPKVKGLIAINCEGQTRGYRYSCVPFLLMADLHRAGFNLRKPPVFHRVGIPGSGGPDWLRNDYEPIVCVTRPGKLPWSDNTACGHPPKWAPGGEMAHRLSDGTRINQWGKTGSMTGTTANGNKEKPRIGKARPSHKILTVANGKQVPKWLRDGMHSGVQNKVRMPKAKKKMYARNPDCTRDEDEFYEPPAIANPGNVIELIVGGGAMGHPLAHDSEAPFPLELPAFFIKSFCPPDGICADPFAGSGTTIDAAIQHGRRGIGCDIRQSQIELIERRMSTVTPCLEGFA